MTLLIVLILTGDMAQRDHLVRIDDKISVFEKRIGINRDKLISACRPTATRYGTLAGCLG